MKSKCCNVVIEVLGLDINVCSNCGTLCEVDPFYTIKIKPLSVNKMYIHKAMRQKGTNKWVARRIKTQEARTWQEDVHYLLPKNLKFEGKLILKLELAYSSANSDLDNGIKAIQDALQSKYGFNDNMIYNLEARKLLVKKGDEYFRFNLKQL